MDNSTLSKIVAKYLKGEASESEMQELNTWRKASESNELFMQQFEQSDNAFADYQIYKNFEEDKVWSALLDKVQKKKRISLGQVLIRVAAVLVLGLIVSSIFYVLVPNDRSLILATVETVSPGQFNAILKIDKQQEIHLSDTTSQELKNSGTYIATIAQGKLAYKLRKNVEPQEMEVVVPNRAEYQFIFADGTKVWMNAGSRVKFKQPFDSETREVYAEGEVFFEVAKDVNRPFIVSLPNDNAIQVLGTEFNVRAYPDDASYQSVLVEGSVLWHTQSGKERLMEPGQLLNYQVNNGEVELSDVDVYPYHAWKEGRFVYDGSELVHIMSDLSRWYGVDVVYNDQAIRKLHFSVDIKRYENLSEILEMLALTEKVQFNIQESTVKVERYQ